MPPDSSHSYIELEMLPSPADKGEHVESATNSAELVGPAPDDAQASAVRYGVLYGLCVMAMLAYVQRNSIVVAEATIRTELGLLEMQMGTVMIAFFVMYALFQIPTGCVAHMWGVRRAFTQFTLVFSLMTGLFTGRVGWVSLIAVRLGMGSAQAGIFRRRRQPWPAGFHASNGPCQTGRLAVACNLAG